MKLHLICHKVDEVLGIEAVPCHSVSPKTIVLQLHLYSCLSIIPFKRLFDKYFLS